MNQSAIEIFKTENGNTVINVILENETVWLNLNQISILFDRDKFLNTRHIGNVFKEQELERNSVVAIFATTADDGKIYQVEFVNLEIIISVGSRVNSNRCTQFRIWANRVLKEYLVKGFALNERKLQQQNEQLKELNSKLFLKYGNQQAA